jgi:hypothetical protein
MVESWRDDISVVQGVSPVGTFKVSDESPGSDDIIYVVAAGTLKC